MPSDLSDLDWAAICLASESNQPHEWKYIAWVIKLRADLKNRYPNTIRDVVLDPSQFSYFNLWTGKRKDREFSDEEIWNLALRGYAGRIYGENKSLLYGCAQKILSCALWEAPFALDTYHYYSPVSMKPKGSRPMWEKGARLLFTPSGVDPNRFVFASGVA